MAAAATVGVQRRSQKLVRMSAHRYTGSSSWVLLLPPPAVYLTQFLHAGWQPWCEMSRHWHFGGYDL
jgi:hypothetical protein